MIELRKLPLWEVMPVISLEQMNSIRLMNRIDSKYVASIDKLPAILKQAYESGYMVCAIDGSRVLDYYSLYYDTPNLSMYLTHHSGKKVRQKIRVRTYMISNTTYLEVKNKNNKGRTKKKRIEIPKDNSLSIQSHNESMDFLKQFSWWNPNQLSASLSTSFSRITLVNASKTERVTIDTALSFQNFRNSNEANLSDAVIIEVKQDGRATSQFKNILLDNRVLALRVSKYCIGTALTTPDIKKSRFKEKIRFIEKVIDKRLCYLSK